MRERVVSMDETGALQPALNEAEETLRRTMDEACASEPEQADTGELIRIEEMLAIASDAAKRAISIRRRLRTSRTGRGGRAADEGTAPPQRAFVDASGVEWVVWAVHPEVRGARQSQLRGSYSEGWLAFESVAGKRRLSPIPSEWATCDEAMLADLCARAEPARPRPERPRDGGITAD
jgi:hypothetical protein